MITLYWSAFTEYVSEAIYARLLERCSNHLLVKLADHLDLEPIEKECRMARHTSGAGRPLTYPVGLLVRCLVVKYLEDLSLRELEQRLCSDLLVRWFVGLGLFAEVPDHSTLERFEQWVCSHHPRLFFDTVIKQIDEQFPHSRHLTQVGDTYAMLASAAMEDLVPRLRHMTRLLLEGAVETMPELLSPTVSRMAWHELFGSPWEPLVFFLDAQQRQQRLQTVVLAVQEVHQRFSLALQPYSRQAYPEVRQYLSHLGKILHDEVVILAEPGPEGSRVHLRTTKERRKDPQTNFRIGSATDPEATYRVHGPEAKDVTFGYNIQVAASLDGFIHETQAYTGAMSDQAGVAALVGEQLTHQGYCPPKIIYDTAAGAGKTRAEVERVSNGGTLLVAREIPFAQRSDRFGPYQFSLSENGQALTCPNGQVSTTAYPSSSGDGRDFRFFACQCWGDDPPKRKDAITPEQVARRCPLWEACRDPRQGPGGLRQVFISDYRSQVLAARIYTQSASFQLEMRQRPWIERIIFELTHYNGARQCRRRGRDTADWQAKMCAMAYNLKLWMRKVSGSGTPTRRLAAAMA